MFTMFHLDGSPTALSIEWGLTVAIEVLLSSDVLHGVVINADAYTVWFKSMVASCPTLCLCDVLHFK